MKKDDKSRSRTPKRKPTTSSARRSISPKRKRTSAGSAAAPPTPTVITQNARPTLPPPPVQDLTEPDAPDALDAPLLEDRSGNGDGGAPPFLDPRRTPLAAAFRFIQPTWRNYIMYVDMEARAGNEDARRYVEVHQALSPRERRQHWPEQLCDLAAIQAADLIAMVARQAYQEGAAKSAMCLSFMRDGVLEKTAQFAMDSPDNYKHAELFMKTAGMLPQQPGGRSVGPVQFFNNPVASSGSVALAGSKSDSSPVDRSGLRSMDAEIVELSQIMQTGGTTAAAEKVPDEPAEEDEDDDNDTDEDDES